ncbi:lipid A phosphoethanolamine transferase [Lysobacter enzymogenes]|nr:lipid A phosphoethanolamine transferase [Lysobacter enzymogenes]
MRLAVPHVEKPRRMAGLFSLRTRYAALALLFLIGFAPGPFLLAHAGAALDLDERITVLAAGALSLAALYSLLWRFPRTITAVLGACAALAAVELRFIADYDWPINANTLSLIAETNPAEAGDLASSIPLGLVLGELAIVMLVWLAWPRADAHAPARRIDRRALAYSAAGSAGLLALALISSPATSTLDEDSIFPSVPYGQMLALRASYPAGFPWVVVDYVRERTALMRAFRHNQNFRFGASATKSDRPRMYVLVIGETARADRWEINGYPRATTPRLARRDDLVSFKHMMSPWSYSRYAVPLLISRKPPEMRSAVYKEASIVTAFKEAGFRTTWISLQAPVGFYESPISIHAYEADDVRFLNSVDYSKRGKSDLAALPEIRKLLADGSARDQFVVVHTLGSHFRYTDRYPPAFARFLPDRPADRPLRLFDPGEREALSNAYDNTILFTDTFLDEVIRTLETRPGTDSWMFYSSDHGEALFDDCRQQSGHGQSSRQTHSVASVFWASPGYADRHGAALETLRGRRETLLSTAMIFETLADLGGLSVPGQRPQNSLVAPRLRLPAEVVTAFDDSGGKCPEKSP